MTVSVRRQRVAKSPEDRRRDIMDAAVSVFSQKTIPGATVSDITEAAGVAKGTFYLYFDSKEHLLAALKERFVEETVAATSKYVARIGQEDWWALAESVVEGIVEFSLANPASTLLFTQELHTPETEGILAECERRLTEMFAAGIRAGAEAGAFSVTDPEITATFIHNAMHGAIIEAIVREDEPDPDRLIRAGKELVRKLLSP